MPGEKDDHPLYAAINAKLGEVAAACPAAPPWYEAWAVLGPQSSKEERLAVYRAVRAAGSVPAEASFFLVAWLLDVLTDDRAPEGLREPEDRLEAIRQRYGLDEDVPADADGVPEEYRDALRRCHDALDALYAATLEEFGERDLARLFRDDREEFDRRYKAGQQFFHGPRDSDEPDGDDWLDLLQDAVTDCVEPDSPMGPLGLRYREEEGFWEVMVYPMPVELVGGAHDGRVVAPGFRLDLEQLRGAFDSVAASVWDALGLNGPEGPHVSVEGVFRGREVWLQVLAYAPEDEGPGLKLDATPRRRRPE